MASLKPHIFISIVTIPLTKGSQTSCDKRTTLPTVLIKLYLIRTVYVYAASGIMPDKIPSNPSSAGTSIR